MHKDTTDYDYIIIIIFFPKPWELIVTFRNFYGLILWEETQSMIIIT